MDNLERQRLHEEAERLAQSLVVANLRTAGPFPKFDTRSGWRQVVPGEETAKARIAEISALLERYPR